MTIEVFVYLCVGVALWALPFAYTGFVLFYLR
jgi:hypothetical protein